MKNDNGLAIAFFAMVVGGAVALAIANDIAAPLCETAREASWGAQKPFIGCIEFWFERYQSFLGNVLTAGVAAATLLWIKRQLEAADKQVLAANRQAATAAAAALRVRVHELQEEEATVLKTLDAMGMATAIGLDKINGLKRGSKVDTLDQISELWPLIRDNGKHLRQYIRMNLNDDAQTHREAFISATVSVGVALRLASNTALFDRNKENSAAIEPRVRMHLEEAAKLRQEAQIVGSRLRGALGNQIEETWAQIREFEGAAISVK